MKNNSNPNYIDPTLLYTPNSLAGVIQVDEEWVKRNMIYNRSCRFKKRGQRYFILGKWVIEWVESDHNYPDKEDDES